MQVTEKMNSVGLSNLKVMLHNQLSTYLKRDPKSNNYLHIVDEYYHIVEFTSYVIDPT